MTFRLMLLWMLAVACIVAGIVGLMGQPVGAHEEGHITCGDACLHVSRHPAGVGWRESFHVYWTGETGTLDGHRIYPAFTVTSGGQHVEQRLDARHQSRHPGMGYTCVSSGSVTVLFTLEGGIDHLTVHGQKPIYSGTRSFVCGYKAPPPKPEPEPEPEPEPDEPPDEPEPVSALPWGKWLDLLRGER